MFRLPEIKRDQRKDTLDYKEYQQNILQDSMKKNIHYQSGSKSKSHVQTTALVIQQHFWQLAWKDGNSTTVTEMGKHSKC